MSKWSLWTDTRIHSFQILSMVLCTLPPRSRLSFPIMCNEQGESVSRSSPALTCWETMVWGRWVWSHETLMVEKEPSSAVCYHWDLGHDFVSLTLRLFFCDLWFISVHSSQGRGSPSPSTEECKINASVSFTAFRRPHLVLSPPNHPYSSQPEPPAWPQTCHAFPCTGRWHALSLPPRTHFHVVSSWRMVDAQ